MANLRELMQQALREAEQRRLSPDPIERPPAPAPVICQICHDAGWLRAPASAWDGKGRAPRIRCTCKAEEDRQRGLVQVSDLFTDDNIPPRMAPWTFETLPASVDPQAREVVQRFVQQLLSDPNPRYRALTLYSHEGGHCKTGLAVSAMKELMQAGWPCVFLNEKDIFTWLQASQDAQQRIGRVSGYEDANLLRNDTFSSSRGARLIRLLEEVKFAVYDDLGTWHGGRNVVRELYGIINNRMNNCLCTIFTSNLDLQGLRSHLSPDGGMRVVDRIGEYSAFYKVEGPNQRKRQ